MRGCVGNLINTQMFDKAPMLPGETIIAMAARRLTQEIGISNNYARN